MTRTVIAVVLLVPAAAAAAEPIKLHPENPHYFLFRGKPTVLITSAEHYGAVLNRDFDYKRYLKTLEKHGFNQTRTFSGAYCEHPGAFNIEDNTLAPAKGKLLCAWARSDTAGYANGGNKFDLTKWDPAYFKRLRDFVTEAGKRGVVVEFVLFCPFYKERMWRISPMNAANNVNGVGKVKREEVYTLKHPKLLAVQEAMVKKVVAELKDFDNLYYEICNEPYFGGVTAEWQDRIAAVIVEAEKDFTHKHLIARNIANKFKKVEKPNPHVSIFNFHYAEPRAALKNYGLGKALGDDETGFKGGAPKPYRIEGWEFMLSGGAVYSNLDYSFTVGKEDGSANPKAPGSRGPAIRKQLEVLKDFLNGFDFVKMKPDNGIVKRIAGGKATARALVEPGRAYAIYVRGDGPVKLTVALPAGTYRVEWVDTRIGKVRKSETLKPAGGKATLQSPDFKEDIALRIKRAE